MHRTLPRHLLALLTPLFLMLAAAPAALVANEAVDAAESTPSASASAEKAGDIAVAIVDDSEGKASGPKNLMGILTPEAGFRAVTVTSQQVQEGILTEQGFDVVIFPGGSGSGQARRLKDTGAENVRQFVADGGGYVGFCAGAYLATSHYTWSLNLINATVVDTRHWNRGTGIVTVRFTDAGREALDHPDLSNVVYYGQGPLLVPGDHAELPPYEKLASYATEIAKKGAPSGVMIGTTAIARAPYHAGRVFCFSPHPEKETGPHDLVLHAVRWAADNDATD